LCEKNHILLYWRTTILPHSPPQNWGLCDLAIHQWKPLLWFNCASVTLVNLSYEPARAKWQPWWKLLGQKMVDDVKPFLFTRLWWPFPRALFSSLHSSRAFLVQCVVPNGCSSHREWPLEMQWTKKKLKLII